jgi:uncharacterized membrane protein YphA (DoxX/SURF4 family)
LSGQIIQIAGFAASIFAGLVFLVAGIDKLRHRALLPGVIANYRLLPAALVSPAAWLLPIAELLVAIALLVGSRPLAPAAAILLLLVFAAAMAINIGRGRRHIDCGCGHAGLRQTLGWPMVLRNLGMAAALSIRIVAPAPLGMADIAVGVAAGAMLFLLMLMFNALKALPGQQPGGARG